jgi:photosystem II stability/assembly factor-like uncharacterized protein
MLGSPSDAFVAKVNPTGSALIYSTYLGGSLDDLGFGIAVDANGNASVTGGTRSMNFPTANALQPMFGGGFSDAFVAKLNADGRTFVYSTYLGGNHSDAGFGLAVDMSGNAYATGFTQSSNFPTTRNTVQPAFAGGLSAGPMGFGGDAFVAKLNPTGRRFVYSTYLGGRGDDGGGRIVVDADGNAYLTGATKSADFPTANAVQPVLGGRPFFKSTDGGSNWNAISNGLMGTGVKALVIDPTNRSTLYAGTSTSGVFKSTDGGTTWRAINTGLTNTIINTLAIDPRTPTTLYAGTDGGGVFKSTDGGASWRAINTGLTNMIINTIVIDPTNPATLYAGALPPGGAFKSTDGGTTWSTINNGLIINRVEVLAIDPTSPATLYASTPLSVFKSTDGGNRWSRSFGGATVFALAIDPTNPATVYAGGTRGILKTTDGGTSSRLIIDGLTSTSVHALAIDPATPATVYAGTSGGAFKSTDGGSHWDATSLISRVDALTIDPAVPTTIYAGTAIGADAFVMKLNQSGSALVFSTYLGGSNTDFGIGIAVDAGGNVYVTGATFSINFPVMNPVQMALGGSSDAFVVKLEDGGGSP